MIDYSSLSPVAIDTRIAEDQAKIARLEATAHSLRKHAAHAEKNDNKLDAHRYDREASALELEAEVIFEALAPYFDQYTTRRWTRAYLVNNSNGHVHRSTACSTCFPTTSYQWLTQLSGDAEEKIVDLAGERACTVCYPTAPVEVLNKPTRLFTDDEVAAQAARAEREAKREAKAAAAVYDPQNPTKRLYKTERGALNMALTELDSMIFYGVSHPSNNEWVRTVTQVLDAMAARGYDRKALAADLYAKALKKAKREGYTTIHSLPLDI